MFLSLLGRNVCLTCENVIKQQVRFAGHSKWSNIRHIKGAKDQQRGKLTHQYVNRISNAIRDKGGDNNPDTNAKLKRILAEAYSANIPKASLQGALKNFKASDTQEFNMEVSLPGGIALLLECVAKSRQHADLVVLTALKKRGGSLEKQQKTKFEQKGVILAEIKKESLELLEDDAIEAGAEDVSLLEGEDNMAEFTTGVLDLSSVKEILQGKGYKCVDSSILYIPVLPGSPNQLEIKAALSLKETLEQTDIVMAVHPNF